MRDKITRSLQYRENIHTTDENHNISHDTAQKCNPSSKHGMIVDVYMLVKTHDKVLHVVYYKFCTEQNIQHTVI